MVELRSVGYRTGETVILDDVSLSFRPQRFNVILGPNGAGKSTLLKLATGLLAPASGEVLFDGQPIGAYGAETLARKRAVLSQRIEMAFALPVQDVVMMGRYPHFSRVPSKRDREIVDQALELVGMSARRKQDYPTLSGGERQKVQLARVLSQIWGEDGASGNSYLFLDEPVASLDIHYQIHMLDIAHKLLGQGCTVVAILHDLNLAFQYGDSFLVLEAGRVACVADKAADIRQDVIERVFDVRAHQVTDAADRKSFWRFSL